MPVERFRDRETAGQLLAAVLGDHDYQHPLVLGIPRGGMVVAAEVAKVLTAELGIVVSRRLEAPYQSELALGAVTANGVVYIDSALAEEVGAHKNYLLGEQHRQAEHARRHQDLLSGSRSYWVEGREVLVITDGLTTGASAIAAVRMVKDAGATRVIVAMPVASPDAIKRLQQEAKDVVCLSRAPSFLSVAQFYDNFRPIDDNTIRDLLQ